MIEFFLSKVWLFVCGIVVTGVLVMAFTGVDHSITDDESQRRVSQVASALDSVADSSDRVAMTIKADDYLKDDRSTMLISKGYVCIRSGDVRNYAAMHATVVQKYGNGSEDLTLAHGDILLVENGMGGKGLIQVHVANVRTVSWTA
jgi:hypothetical protein